MVTQDGTGISDVEGSTGDETQHGGPTAQRGPQHRRIGLLLFSFLKHIPDVVHGVKQNNVTTPSMCCDNVGDDTGNDLVASRRYGGVYVSHQTADNGTNGENPQDTREKHT